MASLLAEIRGLVPVISARSAEIEAARRLPADLALVLAKTGVFRMLVPRERGGLQVTPRELFDVLENLGSADASVGWCAMIAATSGLTSAYLSAEAAAGIYGDPLTITGGVFAPMGRAIADGDDFIVTGKWQWASGSANCHWLMGGCLILDDGKPRMLPNGMPDSRMMMFPAQQVTLNDTWHVVGLCGTGSGEMEVKDFRVPKAHSVSLLTDRPSVNAPLYAFPAFGLLALSIAAVMLGNARAALENLTQAITRKPAFPARNQQQNVQRFRRALPRQPLSGALRGPFIWRRSMRPGRLHNRAERSMHPKKAALRLAATYAVRTSAKITSQLYDMGGGSSVFLANSLQRRFRDAHVGTQHLMVAPQTYELVGRILAGLPTDTLQL